MVSFFFWGGDRRISLKLFPSYVISCVGGGSRPIMIRSWLPAARSSQRGQALMVKKLLPARSGAVLHIVSLHDLPVQEVRVSSECTFTKRLQQYREMAGQLPW